MFLVDHELPTSSCDNINESTNSPFQEPVEEIDEPNEGNETNEGIAHNVESVVNTNINTNNKRYRNADGHSPAQNKKICEDRERKLFLAKCTEALNSKPTENDALGQYISAKLEKVVNPEQKMYAEALLTKVLNKAIMGQLNEFVDVTYSNVGLYPSNNFSHVSPGSSAHSSLASNSFPSPSLSNNYSTAESTPAENVSPMGGLRAYFSSAGRE
ncbi:uncharacterized protein LOC113376302 [Ctenocephalides felis]|nr:uncharacterized protein LOC113376302 [Ctenocephalides felis]